MEQCQGCGKGKAGAPGGVPVPLILGALAGLAGIVFAARRKEFRPYLRGAMREAYGLKEWLKLHATQAKEDLEDLAAEAEHDYRDDLQRRLEAAEKQAAELKKLAAQQKRKKTASEG